MKEGGHDRRPCSTILGDVVRACEVNIQGARVTTVWFEKEAERGNVRSGIKRRVAYSQLPMLFSCDAKKSIEERKDA